MFLTLPFCVGLKGQEHESGVGSCASEAESGNSEGTADFRNVLGDRGNLPADLPGVIERSTGGSLNGDDEISLIFIGYETLGHLLEDKVGETESGYKQDERNRFEAENQAERVHIGVGDGGKDTIDQEGEPIFCAVQTAEQQRCERRRQSESVEGGDGDGERDRQRKLAEEDAGGTGEKGDGDEDGDQNERGGDDGAGDFFHGGGSSFGRTCLALLQMALDVFNHDNHVVDHQPRRQSDAEKRERVDGEAKDLDESEGADE